MDRPRAKCGKAGLLLSISAGIFVDHRGRIGLVDRHEIGHPTQPATVGVIRPKMDMALKRSPQSVAARISVDIT